MNTVMLVHKTSACKRLMHDLLLYPPALVSLVVTLGINGEVLLLQVGLEEGQVYIFDIKENGKLIMDGHLWRLLQTPEIVKVMHGGCAAVQVLHRKYAVCVRSIYDTQVAYDLAMAARGLPCRKQSLLQLYHTYSDPGYKHTEHLKAWSHISDMAWAQRPLPRHLVDKAAVASHCLLPTLYQKLQDVLSTNKIEMILHDSSSGQSAWRRCLPSIIDN